MQTMSKPYMQYEHETGIVARWHGGEYIEIGYLTAEAGTPDAFIAEDVINVWDYEKGQPRIQISLDAMQQAVDEHLE